MKKDFKLIVQQDMQIRTKIAMVLRSVVSDNQLFAKDICEKANMVPSYLSVLMNDRRGVSLINAIKLLLAFPLKAKIQIVTRLVFPEVFLTSEDVDLLLKFFDEGRKRNDKIVQAQKENNLDR